MRLYDELKVKNLKLLGKIQHLRGSIQVCCRVRPPSEEETQAGGQLCVDATDEGGVYVYEAESGDWSLYEVDTVWGYDHSQADVFADVEPLVGSVVDGHSACVMAYGDAQSGEKTVVVFLYSWRYVACIVSSLMQIHSTNLSSLGDTLFSDACVPLTNLYLLCRQILHHVRLR